MEMLRVEEFHLKSLDELRFDLSVDGIKLECLFPYK